MQPSDPKWAIAADRLGKKFGAVRAVDDVSFTVAEGECVALFGPNGAGKTTLLRLLTCSLRPTSGAFRICGLDPRSDDLEIRRRSGLVSHQTFLYDDLTAKQNLQFFAKLYGHPDPDRRAAELLRSMALESRSDDAVGTFSRGMQQRVALARALVHEPPLLFLDEPFTGLDPHAARMLRARLQRIRSEERTILMSTHDLARGLELSDRWMILYRGRIIDQGESSGIDPAGFQRDYFERIEMRSSA
jgi:heme exporter protein A